MSWVSSRLLWPPGSHQVTTSTASAPRGGPLAPTWPYPRLLSPGESQGKMPPLQEPKKLGESPEVQPAAPQFLHPLAHLDSPACCSRVGVWEGQLGPPLDLATLLPTAYCSCKRKRERLGTKAASCRSSLPPGCTNPSPGLPTLSSPIAPLYPQQKAAGSLQEGVKQGQPSGRGGNGVCLGPTYSDAGAARCSELEGHSQ